MIFHNILQFTRFDFFYLFAGLHSTITSSGHLATMADSVWTVLEEVDIVQHRLGIRMNLLEIGVPGHRTSCFFGSKEPEHIHNIYYIYIISYYIILYYVMLYYIILCYIILYYIILYVWLCMYIYNYVCIYNYVYIYIMYVYIYYKYVYIYIYIINMYIYIYIINMYMYIYILCIYI